MDEAQRSATRSTGTDGGVTEQSKGTLHSPPRFSRMTETHAKVALFVLAVVMAAAVYAMVRYGFRPSLSE